MGAPGLLALAFLAHGLMLLFPPPAIAGMLLASFPRWFWVFLGVAEVAAALGLTLPGLTGIQPRLVPAAAAGIVLEIMIGATIFHLMRGEVGLRRPPRSSCSSWQPSSRPCGLERPAIPERATVRTM